MTEQTKYKMTCIRKKELPSYKEETTLTVEGQTDDDTLRLFQSLKKEVGFTAEEK